MSHRLKHTAYGAGFVVMIGALLATMAGCGIITDKDRIRVAKVGEEYLTRGDLTDTIRKMPAEERPQIRTKGDLRVALSGIIDDHIKQGQAAALKAQGKINVTREEAEALYVRRYLEKYVEYMQLKSVLPESDLVVYEEERQLGVDREEERLYGQRALVYLINEAVQNGTLVVTDEQYNEQYELRKGQMFTFEQVAIQGVYLPLDAHEDVYAEATKVKQQLENGADPKTVAESYGEDKAGFLEALLNNQVTDMKFAMFWQQASGRTEGDVISTYIPGWQRNVVIAGEQKTEPIPDSQLVCRITKHVPARQKTLDEAKPDLRNSILFAQMMERLRDKAGVKIYDDKLPDPGMYDAARPASVFEQ